ncbi:MAG: hypothetical protein KDJ15_06250 [Alphaproteobacteria bacterium]|nr:hypothetical protein [Alphaproteobacteria bacterium]
MSIQNQYTPQSSSGLETTPFESAEEAWFWFIQAQRARDDGARFTFGAGLLHRPCEPMDILKVAERLHRNRRLVMDHFMVLRHYGRRMMAPDPTRAKEIRAYKLWSEAMERLEEVFVRKGIVVRPNNVIPFSAFSERRRG